MENSRQYLLLRTDTGKLQKTVVGSFKLGQNNEHESIKKAGPWEKGKKDVKFTRKFRCKSSSATHLHFLPSNPTIQKAFTKTFPTEMKLNKCPARGIKQKKMCKKWTVLAVCSQQEPITYMYWFKCISWGASYVRHRKWTFCIWLNPNFRANRL